MGAFGGANDERPTLIARLGLAWKAAPKRTESNCSPDLRQETISRPRSFISAQLRRRNALIRSW